MKPTSPVYTISIRLPQTLRESIPTECTVNKFVVQAVREKLARMTRPNVAELADDGLAMAGDQ
jgi:hypothetical protein